jgi:hypothetical protein
MTIIILSILFLYVLGVIASPFPYWPSYFRLWRHVLFDRDPMIPSRLRLSHALFLSRCALLCPLWSLLWYVDEIVFSRYNKQQISRPVFIVSQPRSGSTFLHRTMSVDTKHFAAVRHIEWRFPFIVVQRFLTATGLMKRITQRSYWPKNAAGQLAGRMHKNVLGDFEEDGIFFEERFLHHGFVSLRFPYVRLQHYFDGFGKLPERARNRMLRVHGKVIKKMLYLRGGQKSFLSKEALETELGAYFARLYPDAVFISILRDSNGFLNSCLQLMRRSTLAKTGIDPINLNGWHSGITRALRTHCRKQLSFFEDIGEERQIRLPYDEFVSDIASTLQYVYARLGLEVSDAQLRHLENLQDRQRRRKRGYETGNIAFDGFDFFDDFAQEVRESHRACLASSAP